MLLDRILIYNKSQKYKTYTEVIEIDEFGNHQLQQRIDELNKEWEEVEIGPAIPYYDKSSHEMIYVITITCKSQL